ncbi:MFS transporter [Pseudalkalibacillus caeni]|nr:MFS transporter [Pseudalkalibacillus caeni]
MDQLNKKDTIWQNKTFMKMFTAYSISIFGDWFDIIAISVLLAYTWNSDPLLIALVPITFALPGILLGSFAGVLADRWRKVHIMFFADIISSGLTLLLLMADNIYAVLPVLFLRSTIGLLNMPAQQALTRNVVTEEQLLKATSMNQIVNQMAKVAGPLLGALVLAVLSPKLCILINAISSVMSASILFTLRNIKENEKHTDLLNDEQKPGFRDSWKEGFSFILQRKIILFTMAYSLMGLMAIQFVDGQFAVLFREIAPNRPSLIGWVIAASGLGAVISMMCINRFKTIKYGWAIAGGNSLIGISFAGIGSLGVGVHAAWPILLGLLAGLGNGIWMVAYNYLLQQESSKEMVGRIFGIQNSLSSIVFIVAPLSGGTLIHFMGPSQIFQWLGISVCIIGAIGLVFQRYIWGSDPLKTVDNSLIVD